jgi:hypothetical protein
MKLESDSTLKFREPEDVEYSLKEAGFSIMDIWQAPDRPCEEYVFIEKK